MRIEDASAVLVPTVAVETCADRRMRVSLM
jgi:hypothetical protein